MIQEQQKAYQHCGQFVLASCNLHFVILDRSSGWIINEDEYASDVPCPETWLYNNNICHVDLQCVAPQVTCLMLY